MYLSNDYSTIVLFVKNLNLFEMDTTKISKVNLSHENRYDFLTITKVRLALDKYFTK